MQIRMNANQKPAVGPDQGESEATSTAARSQPLHFDIFTLFPSMFVGPFDESILRRARERDAISWRVHDIRQYTTDRHHVCDETPYGGGGGMVMKPEPILRAVETVLVHPPGWQLSADDAYVNLPPWDPEAPAHLPGDVAVILLSPQGRRLDQTIVVELAAHRRLALICGRYEGVDDRVRTLLAADEISIGDYVLSGGELAAMVMVDAIARVLPGVLGHELGAHHDSHSSGLDGLLEGPHYTRPPVFRQQPAPDILLSGHHAQVNRWRREQALLRTLQRRPELLHQAQLDARDQAFLAEHGWIPPAP